MKNSSLNIIIEGPDNVGKGTLINNIKNSFNNYTLHQLHYSNVKHKSNQETIKYSTKLYTEMFNILSNILPCHNGFICDRSHIGEMVYGPIYRNYTGDYVLDIENKFINDVFWKNLILVVLIDEPENIINRDDGLSFTTDIEKKQVEIDNFISAYHKSNITNKLLVNVKDYNENELSKHVNSYIIKTLRE